MGILGLVVAEKTDVKAVRLTTFKNVTEISFGPPTCDAAVPIGIKPTGGKQSLMIMTFNFLVLPSLLRLKWAVKTAFKAGSSLVPPAG